eukprot:7382883-Prymnesium_polylepis.1
MDRPSVVLVGIGTQRNDLQRAASGVEALRELSELLLSEKQSNSSSSLETTVGGGDVRQVYILGFKIESDDSPYDFIAEEKRRDVQSGHQRNPFPKYRRSIVQSPSKKVPNTQRQ